MRVRFIVKDVLLYLFLVSSVNNKLYYTGDELDFSKETHPKLTMHFTPIWRPVWLSGYMPLSL